MDIRYPTTSRSASREPAEGNARLTATTSLVLLVLFVIEVGTAVVGVGSHLTVHVLAGLLLVPPLLVKTASVSWRFFRYYRHDADYRRKGPPVLALRIAGPFLLVDTLIMVSSGITLLLTPNAFGGPHGIVYHVHAFSALAWVVLIVIHVAGHARDLRHLGARDWMRRTRAAVPGARVRQAIALASLAAGLALALSLVGHAGAYLKVANHAVGTSAPAGRIPQ